MVQMPSRVACTGRGADAVLVVVEKKEKERETDQQVSCNVSAGVCLSKRE